jgi:hypothetical protein
MIYNNNFNTYYMKEIDQFMIKLLRFLGKIQLIL